MGKVIRLTESDLTNIVKKVIEEQSMVAKGSIGKAKSEFPDARTRNYQVVAVEGSPMADGKVIAKMAKLGPNTLVQMRKGDKVTMSSISPVDRRKYFQGVDLYVNEMGKLELFVHRA
jgi:hypothetical protein